MVRAFTFIQHVNKVPELGNADRKVSAARRFAHQIEPCIAYGEDRDFIAPCVYGQQETPIVREHHRVLRLKRVRTGIGRQWWWEHACAAAQPARGDFLQTAERSVFGAVENYNSISRACIGHDVDPACVTIVKGNGFARQRNKAQKYSHDSQACSPRCECFHVLSFYDPDWFNDELRAEQTTNLLLSFPWFSA